MSFKIKKISFLIYNILLILALFYFFTKNKNMDAISLVSFGTGINYFIVYRFYKKNDHDANFTIYFIYLVLLTVYTLHVYHLLLL